MPLESHKTQLVYLFTIGGFLLCMIGKEGYTQKWTNEEKLTAQVDDGIRDLLGEMQQGKSDRLQRYFEFSARFHRYSVHNQLLIYLQCPQATFVAGYRKWQEMGYQVAKGERGIRILAPRPREIRDEETGESREIIYFTSVAVLMPRNWQTSKKSHCLFFSPHWLTTSRNSLNASCKSWQKMESKSRKSVSG